MLGHEAEVTSWFGRKTNPRERQKSAVSNGVGFEKGVTKYHTFPGPGSRAINKSQPAAWTFGSTSMVEVYIATIALSGTSTKPGRTPTCPH